MIIFITISFQSADANFGFEISIGIASSLVAMYTEISVPALISRPV